MDTLLERYNKWVVKEKKDSPLIPYEMAACKTLLMWLYMDS